MADISVQQMHADIRLLIPESDGRYFSPEEIDSSINMGVLDLFNQQYKIFEEVQRITDQMARYKTSAVIPVSPGSGIMSPGIGTTPPDLIYTLNIFATKISTTDVVKKVRLTQEKFIPSYVDSEAFAPSTDNIIARYMGASIQIFPNSISEITVAYLRTPIKCKFNYTTAGILDTAFVYNPSGSMQVDYSPVAYNQVLEKALRYLGVAQKDQVLMSQENLAKQNNIPEQR